MSETPVAPPAAGRGAPPRPGRATAWEELPEPCRDFLAHYRAGFFPMAESLEAPTFEWYLAPRRGLMPLDDRFHVPRRLRKFLRSAPFELHFDRDLGATLRACAARPRTWLNHPYIAMYEELGRHGIAHTVEAWREGRQVGGLYGLALGGAFVGESMFSVEREASKACLVALVAHLRARGFALLDAQVLNEHTRQFGAVELPVRRFHAAFEAAVALDRDWWPAPGPWSGTEALARLEASAPPPAPPAPRADS